MAAGGARHGDSPWPARPSRTRSARGPAGTPVAASCCGSTSRPGRVYRDRVGDDGALHPVRDYRLPGTVGAIAPIDGDDGWLLAADRGFTHLAPDGGHRVIAEVAPEGTRMNDAACDPQGRFWAGTLADDHHAGGGALYRLDGSGRAEQMLDGLTIPNGVGWSLDGTTMYLVDSGPRVIHAFAFDADRGAISDERILVTVPEDVGSPDGMTVDAGGDLWVAVYGGGRVQRYSPEGDLHGGVRRPGRADHLLRVRGARAEPAVRHHRDRGVDRRPAARRARGGPGLPHRHRRDRAASGAVRPRPGLVAGGHRIA